MAESIDPRAVLNSLHVFSSQLPIGAFAFSQALEAAIESGQVSDPETLTRWCRGILLYGLGTLDFVALKQLIRVQTVAEWTRLNADLLASRETHELRQEDALVGQALTRWASGIGLSLTAVEPVSVVSRYAEIARQWAMPESVAVLGYGWSWLENQMIVAAKSIPLGQQALSRVLVDLKPTLLAVSQSPVDGNTPWSNSTFMQSLLSAQHETQYSRLFRS
jgi:urease accessory protein